MHDRDLAQRCFYNIFLGGRYSQGSIIGIVVISLTPSASLAYILALVDPGLWFRTGLNISRFIPFIPLLHVR
jgi:glycopeptide antibiotics resistance protein